MMFINTPPAEWVTLIDDFIPDILNLVISAWQEMPPLDSEVLEDHITEALCRCLRQSRARCHLPLRIDMQSVELDPAPNQDQGRMDITFSPFVPDESIYFCLECKRLNVVYSSQVRTYSTEYVVNGMMRFIRGQYSARVFHGGMLGYVLDGNTTTAIRSVSQAVRIKHIDLGMTPPGEMLASSSHATDIEMRETHHIRIHDGQLFRIHHIFVPHS